MRHVPLLLIALLACTARAESLVAPPEAPCSPAWNRAVDARVVSGDGRGHGPDLGSDEWKSVVEFKLGVRGKAGVPSRDSAAWCGYIDRLAGGKAGAGATGPAFDCRKVRPGGGEAFVCADPELSALDRQMADVYRAALRKATSEHPPRLKAEQRGWIKGRDDCWKAAERKTCVRDAYIQRIVELQARYRLVPHQGPLRYQCGNNPADEFVVTLFDTAPPSLIAERGDSVSLMILQADGQYLGRNERLTRHASSIEVTWGYQAPTLQCSLRP